MSVQLLVDYQGKPTGVFIPYKEWTKLKKKYSELQELTPKEEVLNGIRQGLEEVKLIEQGKLKSRPAREFLNEL